MFDAVTFYETPVTLYPSTRRRIPEDFLSVTESYSTKP